MNSSQKNKLCTFLVFEKDFGDNCEIHKMIEGILKTTKIKF
jgi:hypothetical protein